MNYRYAKDVVVSRVQPPELLTLRRWVPGVAHAKDVGALSFLYKKDS